MWLTTTHGMLHVARQGPGEYWLQAATEAPLCHLQEACALRQTPSTEQAGDFPCHLAVTPAELVAVLGYCSGQLDPGDARERLSSLPHEEDRRRFFRLLWSVITQVQPSDALPEAMHLSPGDEAALNDTWEDLWGSFPPPPPATENPD